VEKTYVLQGEREVEWFLFDATAKNIGRLASAIANTLLGKHKPTYTPGVVMGDHVVVINAKKLAISQKKLDEKVYYRHSNYPGGLKAIKLSRMMANHPDRVIRAAVWGMIPHNKCGRKVIKKLHVYAGDKHPHAGQKPKLVE